MSTKVYWSPREPDVFHMSRPPVGDDEDDVVEASYTTYREPDGRWTVAYDVSPFARGTANSAHAALVAASRAAVVELRCRRDGEQ